MTTIDQFIGAYDGQPGIGDTPENDGQCVGLAEVWLDSIGAPHIWGNADDFPAYADRSAYTVTPNSADYVPAPGDLVVFPAGWGGSAVGHVAIVAPGTDINHLVVFEQNDRIGGGDGSCRTYTLPYDGSVFIHPKVLDQAVVTNNQGTIMVTKEVLDSLYRGILGRDPDPGAYASFVGQDIGFVLTNLIGSPEYDARQQAVNQAQQHPNAVTHDILTGLYQGMLGRDPEPQAYSNAVGNDVGIEVQSILGSPEYQGRQAQFAQIPVLVKQLADMHNQVQSQQQTIDDLNSQVQTLKQQMTPPVTAPVVPGETTVPIPTVTPPPMPTPSPTPPQPEPTKRPGWLRRFLQWLGW